MGYFSSITGQWDYLIKSPTKSGCINNAKISGSAAILPESNNRALIITTPESVYLQSYDTLILKYDPKTKKIIKLWNNYTVTTLKHINTFLRLFNMESFNKKGWLAFKGV